MMEVTEEEKKFSCKVCERSFSSCHALHGHMNSHSGDKRDMMEETEEEKKFSCKVCERSFSSCHALHGHMNSHSGDKRDMMEETEEEKKFSCKVCERSFTSCHALRGHMNSHSGDKRDMMEVTEEEKKFSCKVCERSFTSCHALRGHMNSHSGDMSKRKSAYGHEEPEDLTPDSKAIDVSGDLKRKTRSAYGNEEPKDLTPKSKLKFDLNKLPKELLEIDIPESGAEQVGPLSLETWLKDREKIQVIDPASEEKEQIDQATKPGHEADVSLTDLKTTMYECNTCYRTFGSQQALGDHLAGQTSDGTCPQEIESTAVVPRFNCDGYILKSNYVGWATRRRSVKVFISDLVRN